MRPSFHPRLINDPFDDPGVFVPFQFENRAFLFDLGDIHALTARDILKVTHVFVSHTHMDHFSGFERLLRLCLGRDKHVHLYGPGGILKNIEGKLAGYTWNLVDQYAAPFSLHAAEIRGNSLLTREYRCRDGFKTAAVPPEEVPFHGILFAEPALSVSAVVLDHRTDCLGFSLEERFHVNIIKEALSEMGLSVGPWIRDFKQALFNEVDPSSEFAFYCGPGEKEKHSFRLGDLSKRIARITPGQKIVYLTDMAGSPANLEKAVPFAANADQLFVEAAFLEAERRIADEKRHLTARDAGRIAALAGAKQYTLFHHSPRYTDRAEELQREAAEAHRAESIGHRVKGEG
jgi:ribonuclease Z